MVLKKLALILILGKNVVNANVPSVDHLINNYIINTYKNIYEILHSLCYKIDKIDIYHISSWT